MHHALQRVLGELGIDPSKPPLEAGWKAFLERVDAGYRAADAAPALTSSQEMLQLAADLGGDRPKQLQTTRAVLDATLDALADGVLVVEHETRAVSLYNRRFAEMWRIPADALASKDDQRLLGCVVSLLADPNEFFARVGHLYEHPMEVSEEEVKLTDGRIFERHSAPVVGLDGGVLGRVWFFHDATKRVREQEELRVAKVSRLERELAIAKHIQTSLLPITPSIRGLDVAGNLMTATEVGGDYWDVQPTADGGCWVGIGDVSGHGLNAGLVMLMVQSSVASLVKENPDADPSDVVAILNATLYENIRQRLRLDDFVTLSLLRYSPDGRVVCAGAHEDILVWREKDRRCETIKTTGTWLGAMADVAVHTRSATFHLDPGDIVMLHTDGITEARSSTGEYFGFERLQSVLERSNALAVDAICQRVQAEVSEWGERADDQAVVALRYRGEAA